MTDISIRISGRAGRITLTRPQALNAMTYDMCLAIEDAFDAWQHDPKVDLIIIDAEGDRAFCSGGDIAELYATGTKGNYAYGRKFWADEYRLNAKIFAYTKPVVSFLQGFTMAAVLASAVTARTAWWGKAARSRCRNVASVWCPMWAAA
jgi:3-hydroxyisobutyrate dehydrogenase